MHCPHCRARIATEDVNIGADTAMCSACGRLSRPSDAVRDQAAGLGEASVDDPPRGCHFTDDGLDRVWRVSMRNWSVGGFFVIFSTFWCSVTSVFVVVLTSGTLRALGVESVWLPEMSNDSGGSFGESPGELLFGWLFMTPFILIGVSTALFALANLFGRIEVRVRESEGTVRSGLGPLSRTKRFDATGVTRVTTATSTVLVNKRPQPMIELEHSGAGGKISFGTSLARPRMAWLVAALRRDLADGGERGLRFAR